jgi:hypothetical protein
MLCKEKSGNNAQVPRREGKIMEQIIFWFFLRRRRCNGPRAAKLS